MKIIKFIFLLLMLQVLMNFIVKAQPPCTVPIQEQKQQMCRDFFKNEILQKKTFFDDAHSVFIHSAAISQKNGIMKPIKAVRYKPQYGTSSEDPLMIDHYSYDKSGKLLGMITEHPKIDQLEITSYSTKFPADRDNYIDTFTLYKKSTMQPIERLYYDYATDQVNDPYITKVIQQWNPSKARWDNLQKTCYIYLDTLSWYAKEREQFNGNSNNGWALYYKEMDSLVYDDQNNVIQVITTMTFPSDNIFNAFCTKDDYYYPAGSHSNNTAYDSTYHYAYWEPEGWRLGGKRTDITWHQWNGFGYDSNQMSSFHGWYTNEDGSFYLWGQQKYWYDIDGNAGSWSDTIYFYSEQYQRWYPSSTDSETYNEQGDFCVGRNIGWKYLELTGGIHTLNWYNIDSFANEYNKDGLLWRWSNYYTSLDLEVQDRLDMIMEVTEFADVTNNLPELPKNDKQPLSIAPNPVSGVVTIAAATEIKQLQIFDITGTPMKTIAVSADKALFDTGTLPKGIYIVQALLKNGERQMGKLVVP